MDLKLSSPYGGTPEEVFAMLTDATFREQACEATKALSYAVTVTPGDTDTVVEVKRELPSDQLPEMARKFVGQTLTVVTTETWRPEGAGGSRQAAVAGEITGTPVSLRGTVELRPDGAGTVHQVDLDVKVAVPLLGRKLEPFVVDALRVGLQKEHELGRAWQDGRE